MDEFNYLTVLISIILGLGMTRLLTGLGQQIELRGHIRSYWPSLAWAATLLLVHVQTWWSMFAMREHHSWTFVAFLVVLLQPIVLYLLAALVLPSAVAGEKLDLRTHYFTQSRWFFGLLALLLLISVGKEAMLTGALPEIRNLAFQIGFFVLALIGAMTKRERLHQAGALITSALLCAYVLVLFSKLR